jgi:hypothetical protein
MAARFTAEDVSVGWGKFNSSRSAFWENWSPEPGTSFFTANYADEPEFRNREFGSCNLEPKDENRLIS